jgi:hypothetical protein
MIPSIAILSIHHEQNFSYPMIFFKLILASTVNFLHEVFVVKSEVLEAYA